MGTTSDILHYHSTFDDTWSLYQYYTESDYLWKCEPSVHSICLLDRTSDQAKVSTNFRIASLQPFHQLGTSPKSKLQDIYYSWFHQNSPEDGFFAIRFLQRNRSDSQLELLQNQEDSNSAWSTDIDEIDDTGDLSNDHLPLERHASNATQSSHLSTDS